MHTNTKAGKTAKSNRIATAARGPPFDARSFLTSVGAGRNQVKYAPKDVIFCQGDPADAVYYIEKGGVQITVVSDQGKEGVVAMLKAGEFFGEGCLAGQEVHMGSATAVGETVVVSIDEATMVRVLHEQPNLSEMFMTFLLLRNIQIEADLVDQLFNSSERRLARILLLLANFGKDGKLEMVIPKISQETLAAKVGTTRARINFFMNKFRKLGFIEYSGGTQSKSAGLKVHSSLLNVIVHD
jgi:CRP/FNR family transcriptional regulator, cyclic AMP receptor protein